MKSNIFLCLNPIFSSSLVPMMSESNTADEIDISIKGCIGDLKVILTKHIKIPIKWKVLWKSKKDSLVKIAFSSSITIIIWQGTWSLITWLNPNLFWDSLVKVSQAPLTEPKFEKVQRQILCKIFPNYFNCNPDLIRHMKVNHLAEQ